MGRLLAVILAGAWLVLATEPSAQTSQALNPQAKLSPAPKMRLTGDVDSNSPAIWDLSDGLLRLFVITSYSGHPSTAAGRNLSALGAAQASSLDPWPGGGVWMEAIVPDVDGTWYGYYHNEIPAGAVCPGTDKVIPRIGAARSRDQGRTPVFPSLDGWHDKDTTTDQFWGPSVHWNTYLQMYVMLLNRARDTKYDQEGIYVSYSPRLDDPAIWSAPLKILKGGGWYPQVIGVEQGTGTDKVAGEWARFFMSGSSQYLIHFTR